MEIYLDNSATTKCDEAVLEKMNEVYRTDFGNPSAMHQKGVDAEKHIRTAKEQIAATLKVSDKEIFFTSGGTESNNTAIIGAAFANKRMGTHVVTTAYEHASVANPMHFLEDNGFSVTYLPVMRDGSIPLDILDSAIRQDTVLVSIMHVNNEIGSIAPIEEIGALIKKKNPKTLFHVDAIQSYGKVLIRPKKAKIDLLSVSGHKFHGPKGVGFLYIKEGTKVMPLLLGGGQQSGMRSGTENVPGIAGLGLACERAYADLDKNRERLYALKERFVSGVTQIPDVTVNGPALRESAPQIVSVSIRGVRSEVFLHAMEEKGVYVSAGSACSTHKRAASATLTAIGVESDLLESTVRFSFSVHTTMEEIDYALDTMKEIIPKLREFARR